MTQDSSRSLSSPALAAWLVALATGLFVFAIGASTTLSLGDESYHLRKAANFLDAGCRLAFDPTYGPTVPPGLPFYDGALWETGLAALWRVTGQSVLVAQAYEAGWFVLFVGLAWTAGRALGRLINRRAALTVQGATEVSPDRLGWWALAAAASLPAMLFFGGFLLYVEGAMMALLMAAVVCALLDWPLLAGLAFGLTFLVKPTVALTFPAFLLGLVLWPRETLSKRAVAGIWFGLGTALCVLPDLWWRQIHLGTIGITRLSASGGDAAIPADIRAMILEKGAAQFFEVSSIFNLRDLVMYLGAPLLVGVLLALGHLVRGFWKSRGATGPEAARSVNFGLWLMVLVFALPEVLLLARNNQVEIRYAMPILPIFVLLAALAAERWVRWPRRVLALVVAATVLQALAVGVLAVKIRQMPPQRIAAMRAFGELSGSRGLIPAPDDRAAPPWSPAQIKPDAGFALCPEDNLFTYSGVRTLWSAVNPRAFFFVWTPEKQERILEFFQIAYVVIPANRVFDDTHEKHTGGYPQSFIDRLSALPWLDPKPIMDQGGLKVYRVRFPAASR